MNIQLLLTGNELMSGDTVDSNSAWIGTRLRELGLTITRKVTLGDSLEQLVSELEKLCADADVVLVNGGLGPTRDDLTAQALAELSNRPLEEHAGARAHLQAWAEGRGIELNAANLKQAWLPAGADLIPNPRGSAVGIQLRHRNCELLCTPGVPSEMRTMLDETVLPWLAERAAPEQRTQTLRWHTFGLGESTVQQRIDDEIDNWPDGVELGFRAGAPTLEVKLSAPAAEHKALARTRERLHQLIGDYIVAEGQGTLAATLIQALARRGQTLAVAESCTGGLIAAQMTAEAGASEVFECGVVAYANAIKERVLKVSPQTLVQDGAVSESVVQQMTQGVLALSGADYAVAVSGIAGPSGGTEQKPVGTLWIAWGDRNHIETACLRLPPPRKLFQTLAAGTALDLVRRRVEGITSAPAYLTQRQGPERGSAQRRMEGSTP
ncbi:CinA family nicotinamide mononucleotide deamidase-related protein [Motiliproteus sp. SC1-56]|uniref:CinA family nicotinamide mononucleotide deamidase-related protein n=1 Tax=Motiliproteus sp. SC1-56 TaxID=2799565 RepID=UPI001A8DFB78|nr:CinA family nicotinamide mononucleotide deamidase-related protein [Motiliproteus sp. SC1-56]